MRIDNQTATICDLAKKVMEYRTLKALILLSCKYPEYLPSVLDDIDSLTGYARRKNEYTIPHLIEAFKKQVMN